jgi:threonine dehydrogenase-like Zn-dependent dehydrogenase
MKFQAAYFRGTDDVILRETAFDDVRPHERVIAVDACGICGTDINAILRGSPDYVQVGHEIAGRILDENGNTTPRRVVLESSSCRNGRSDLCTDVKSFFPQALFRHRPANADARNFHRRL